MFIINKQEYEKSVEEFLTFVDKEIELWGIYKDSPELQKIEKDKIIAGLLQLPELQKTVMIPKLIQSGIFTSSEIDEAFKIPIEKRIFFSMKDLLESNLPPEEMLIGNGIMPTRGYMVIASREKTGKTLFGLNMALNLVSGTHFLQEYPVYKKCRIVYVYYESNQRNLKEILEKQIEGLLKLGIKIPLDDIDNFYGYDAYEKKLSITLNKSDDLTHFKKSIDIFKPDVIIIDPLGMIACFKMNEAENITKLINLMKNIRNCFWVLIHHSRKPGKDENEADPFSEIRGSSNLANFAETTICIKPGGKNLPANYKKIYFEIRRQYTLIPVEVKFDLRYLNYETIDITNLRRPAKVTYQEVVEFVKLNFKDGASRGDIVMACAQKFCVNEVRIDQLVADAKKAGLMYKKEGKFGKWCVKDDEELPF